LTSQRQNVFFGFFSVEVVLRVMNANQASARTKMRRSLQWYCQNDHPTQSELKRAKILARLPSGFVYSEV
jgi:hypothetical protein